MTDLLPQAGHMPTGNPKADAKAAKAYAKATRPWFKKRRWWLAGAIIVIVGATATSGGGGGEVEAATGNSSNQASNTAKGDKPVSNEKTQSTEPEMTSGQENALEADQNYIDIMPFSHQGLIRQLSSPAGDGYSVADATFAANHVDADWNAEAVEAAQGYLDMMAFSHSGLIEQLSSAAGDNFTPAQARYAANTVL